MREYSTLKALRQAEGIERSVEVLISGEWWTLRGNPKGAIWVSRPGQQAIHALAASRCESFRAFDNGDPSFETPPEVIALGPDAAAEETQAEAETKPQGSRRKERGGARTKNQLKLFG